jgi:hypothetical protein
MQSSIVGLAQALTMFAGTFNKVGPVLVPGLSVLVQGPVRVPSLFNLMSK